MSYVTLFQQAENILKHIKTLESIYPDLGYSFGHIVIDDMNLNHSSIQNCLQSERVQDWVIQKAKDSGWGETLAIANAIHQFLSALLLIPEEVLKQAEDLYHNDPYWSD